MRWLAGVACVLALLGASSCRRKFPSEGLMLGGRHVPYRTLRNGWSTYGIYCRSCHGENGDGRGPASVGMQPAPRDFRVGVVKFASVPSGQLPTDEDLARIIRGGLHGTPMRGWQLPDEDLDAIIQYVKTFSPRWRTERAGVPVAMPADPWAGRETEARTRGEQLYHSVARCSACHASYAPARASVPQITMWGTRAVPPDFTRDALKAGGTRTALFRVIAAGVGGTPMPAWRGVLTDEDLWALVHYVRGMIGPG